MARKSRLRAAQIGLWLLASGCLIGTAAQTEQRPLPDSLFQRWVHSFEDDTAELRVYRPAGYGFPLARGRDGFEIRPDGGFTLLGPGGSDRSTAVKGRWQREGTMTLRVTFENRDLDREIRIAEVSRNILRIRK